MFIFLFNIDSTQVFHSLNEQFARFHELTYKSTHNMWSQIFSYINQSSRKNRRKHANHISINLPFPTALSLDLALCISISSSMSIPISISISISSATSISISSSNAIARSLSSSLPLSRQRSIRHDPAVTTPRWAFQLLLGCFARIIYAFMNLCVDG